MRKFLEKVNRVVFGSFWPSFLQFKANKNFQLKLLKNISSCHDTLQSRISIEVF